MSCPTCDKPEWNITKNQLPTCEEAFRKSCATEVIMGFLCDQQFDDWEVCMGYYIHRTGKWTNQSFVELDTPELWMEVPWPSGEDL